MNYVYAVLLGIALLVGAYYKGVFDTEEKSAAAAKSVRAQDVAIAKAMEPQLTKTLTVSHTVTVTLTKEVPRYVDHYIPAPGAASVARPAYFLTFGAVSLWNGRLGASAAHAAAGAPGGADPLDLSPITFDAAETNAIQNFGQYADCRTIVQGWQDWYRKVSQVKP